MHYIHSTITFKHTLCRNFKGLLYIGNTTFWNMPKKKKITGILTTRHQCMDLLQFFWGVEGAEACIVVPEANRAAFTQELTPEVDRAASSQELPMPSEFTDFVCSPRPCFGLSCPCPSLGPCFIPCPYLSSCLYMSSYQYLCLIPCP